MQPTKFPNVVPALVTLKLQAEHPAIPITVFDPTVVLELHETQVLFPQAYPELQAVQVKTVPEMVQVKQLVADPVIPVVEAEHETGSPAFKTYPGATTVQAVELVPIRQPVGKATHEPMVLVKRKPVLH